MCLATSRGCRLVENAQLKEENTRLRAYIAVLEENARLRTQAANIQMLPVATANEV